MAEPQTEYGRDGLHEDDCEDCAGGPDVEANCPESKRPCGHHCNHSWTHDRCCWCKRFWGEGGEVVIG